MVVGTDTKVNWGSIKVNWLPGYGASLGCNHWLPQKPTEIILCTFVCRSYFQLPNISLCDVCSGVYFDSARHTWSLRLNYAKFPGASAMERGAPSGGAGTWRQPHTGDVPMHEVLITINKAS